MKRKKLKINYVMIDIIHIVSSGDTLNSISNQYNVRLADLISYNHLFEWSKPNLGMEIRIPCEQLILTL